MAEAIQHNLREFSQRLITYVELSKLTPRDALAKQGGKFAYTSSQRLRGLAPSKGQIRTELLADLKAGYGVKVRPRVAAAIAAKYSARQDIASRRMQLGKKGKTTVASKGKRLNLQALMVRAEINTRESGRGFLGVSSRYPRVLKGFDYAFSKFRVRLSSDELLGDFNAARLQFEWGPKLSELSGSAGAGLTRPKANAAIALALRDTTADMAIYIARKHAENYRRAGL